LGDPAPAAVAANDAPAASAADVTPDPELADLLDAPTTPVKVAPAAPALAAKKASARNSSERVIHSRHGDKPVTLNANIALTRADGKTLVGKLLGVDGGFVNVKTADAQMKISESDVLDAATY